MTGGRVRAVLITPAGSLEVAWIQARETPAVGVVPRATWIVKGGDALTLWIRTRPDAPQNDLAAKVVDDMLPEPPPGAPDRIRDSLTTDPVRGDALLTGYQPRRGDQPGRTVDVPDLTLTLIRASADGGRDRRAAAVFATARTVVLPEVPDTAPMPLPLQRIDPGDDWLIPVDVTVGGAR